MNNIIISATNEEIINGKFINTLRLISGYFQEAEGDVDNDRTYEAKTVYDRLENIKKTLESDLSNLAKSIIIKENAL